MWWNGEKNFKETKILESLNQPNLVNFKNMLPAIHNYIWICIISFSPFEAIREIRRLAGLRRFLDYFSVKMMKLFFFWT